MQKRKCPSCHKEDDYWKHQICFEKLKMKCGCKSHTHVPEILTHGLAEIADPYQPNNGVNEFTYIILNHLNKFKAGYSLQNFIDIVTKFKILQKTEVFNELSLKISYYENKIFLNHHLNSAQKQNAIPIDQYFYTEIDSLPNLPRTILL